MQTRGLRAVCICSASSLLNNIQKVFCNSLARASRGFFLEFGPIEPIILIENKLPTKLGYSCHEHPESELPRVPRAPVFAASHTPKLPGSSQKLRVGTFAHPSCTLSIGKHGQKAAGHLYIVKTLALRSTHGVQEWISSCQGLSEASRKP
jgi:hypothetical protein